MKFYTAILLLLLSPFCLAQDSLSTEHYSFEPDKIAKEAVSKIVKYTGLSASFVVVADQEVSTAIAFLKNNKRYIAYNPKFIEKLNAKQLLIGRQLVYWLMKLDTTYQAIHYQKNHLLEMN